MATLSVLKFDDPGGADRVLADPAGARRFPSTTKIADLNGRIDSEVEASGTTLTQIFGVGAILAARIIGTVGNVARFPTKAHFASHKRRIRSLAT